MSIVLPVQLFQSSGAYAFAFATSDTRATANLGHKARCQVLLQKLSYNHVLWFGIEAEHLFEDSKHPRPEHTSTRTWLVELVWGEELPLQQ